MNVASQAEGCAYPFTSEPIVEHAAAVGVRVSEHRRGAELWVVPGSPDEGRRRGARAPVTLDSHGRRSTLSAHLLEDMTDQEHVYAAEFVLPLVRASACH